MDGSTLSQRVVSSLQTPRFSGQGRQAIKERYPGAEDAVARLLVGRI
jgi:hypothetical protein